MPGIRKANVLIGGRNDLNFIEGENITLTIVDHAGSVQDNQNHIDIIIASTGSSSTSHGDLTGVTPDQHHVAFVQADHDGLANPHHSNALDHSNANDHAASHTLASHSAKAHSDLTGIGASDHHSNANDHANTLDHAQLHAAAHASGGGDAVKLDDLAAPDDNTDLNVSTAKHGLMSKLPGGTSTFYRADGTFAAPTAAAADPVYSPGSFTVVTETGRYIPARLKLTTTQRATLEGTGRLEIN